MYLKRINQNSLLAALDVLDQHCWVVVPVEKVIGIPGKFTSRGCRRVKAVASQETHMLGGHSRCLPIVRVVRICHVQVEGYTCIVTSRRIQGLHCDLVDSGCC